MHLLKSSLRKQFLTLRGSVPQADKKRGATELIHLFDQDIPHKEKDVIAGYAPLGSEVDVMPLLQHLHKQGKRVALPVIAQPDAALVFRLWAPKTRMVKGAYSPALEPQSDITVTPTILLTPLLAFDAMGNRLGFGGGYYDRTIAKLRNEGKVMVVGIAYACQETDSLPTENTDQRLDGVLVV